MTRHPLPDPLARLVAVLLVLAPIGVGAVLLVCGYVIPGLVVLGVVAVAALVACIVEVER